MVRRTRKGGRKRKHRRGGNVVGGLLGAIKKALPSYLLYQAVKMQQKKKRGGKRTRRGGRKSKRGGRKSKRGGTRRRR
jgi:hypothetical protein